jgi:hypothetical protein
MNLVRQFQRKLRLEENHRGSAEFDHGSLLKEMAVASGHAHRNANAQRRGVWEQFSQAPQG